MPHREPLVDLLVSPFLIRASAHPSRLLLMTMIWLIGSLVRHHLCSRLRRCCPAIDLRHSLSLHVPLHLPTIQIVDFALNISVTLGFAKAVQENQNAPVARTNSVLRRLILLTLRNGFSLTL